MTDSIGPEQLLARLDDIGAALLRSGHALALIGLGSVGLERRRLDRYSDLDFVVVVVVVVEAATAAWDAAPCNPGSLPASSSGT